MRLTPMRFTTITGTEVLVQVNSPQDAKRAIKELRHRKKEVALHRRAIVRRQKAALKEQARAERLSTQRSRRGGLVAGVARMMSMFRKSQPLTDLAAIDQELHMADELVHSIDETILQIEGKLLLAS